MNECGEGEGWGGCWRREDGEDISHTSSICTCFLRCSAHCRAGGSRAIFHSSFSDVTSRVKCGEQTCAHHQARLAATLCCVLCYGTYPTYVPGCKPRIRWPIEPRPSVHTVISPAWMRVFIQQQAVWGCAASVLKLCFQGLSSPSMIHGQ